MKRRVVKKVMRAVIVRNERRRWSTAMPALQRWKRLVLQGRADFRRHLSRGVIRRMPFDAVKWLES